MRWLRGLLLKPILNILNWLLKRESGNSVIIGGPLGWSWQPTIDAAHHGSLQGPANAHRHSDLANVGPDDHHARDHATRHAVGGGDQLNLDASQIGSGRFIMARMPTSDTANRFLAVRTANSDPTYDALLAADIPNLDASKITSGTLDSARLSTNQKTVTITFVIDGGGAVITTGVKGYLEIPFSCTLTAATLLADQTGSIVVDIWKDTYANFPPTSDDKITGTTPPTISSSNKSRDTTLSGWTKNISAGDILAFNVNSCSTITRVTLSLTATKS